MRSAFGGMYAGMGIGLAFVEDEETYRDRKVIVRMPSDQLEDKRSLSGPCITVVPEREQGMPTSDEIRNFAKALRVEGACLQYAAEELEEKGYIDEWAWTLNREIPEKYRKPKGAKANAHKTD